MEIIFSTIINHNYENPSLFMTLCMYVCACSVVFILPHPICNVKIDTATVALDKKLGHCYFITQ